MSGLENELRDALANVETAKEQIITMKKDCKDTNVSSYLTNYNLELLDVKIRLKDMISNLPKILKE